MPADLTPDRRDQVMALWFVDNIYANLPPEVALSAGHVAACSLAACLAVPPAASEPSDEVVAAEWVKDECGGMYQRPCGETSDAVAMVRAVNAARERARGKR